MPHLGALRGSKRQERFCTLQCYNYMLTVKSVAGVGLRGSIPQIFDSLIDLQIILLNDNPGMGTLVLLSAHAAGICKLLG